ncbi:Molybdopterin biosynthesis MoaE [Lineolata rhizophorae]|uniref:Molybdopterin synthase catalytic subunit n=1 Tax=Lineolata rhizophorae TaxID=578093 RepID=A0A6A6NN28_9PEZI|nr:Molybdopterin biosynthesis MoaE [Lineolata rhizophorae]
MVKEEDGIRVELTYDPLDVAAIVGRVKDPKAGAVVLFAGTTRDNFESKPVERLEYSAYAALALNTMLAIARRAKGAHGLRAVAMVHRLGVVPVGAESVLIAVSAPHRRAAWRAGEEALEACKAEVEIWKREEFGGEGGGVWRANRDGAAGATVDDSTAA